MSKIHSVTVELKVLTPMFTYGEKGICEFRLTELKSLMRTIFREFFYFESLADMKEKEGKIFGSLGGKAPVNFRMINIEDKNNKYIKPMIIKHPLLPHRKEKKDQSNMNSIKIDEIISFKMISWDKEILDLYCQILLLSSTFGSIGKRARKGLGAFKIVNFEEDIDTKYNECLKKEPFQILEEIKNELKNDLKIRNFKEKNRVITFDKYEDNSLDFPCVKEIRIVEVSKDNIDQILFDISKLTHTKVEITENKEEPFKEGIDNHWLINNSILGQHKSANNKVDRFGSLVWISFWQNNKMKKENRYFLIIKILNYDYELLEFYLLRKQKQHKKNNESNKIFNKKQEEIKYQNKSTNEIKNFINANEHYINKYLDILFKIGGEK